MIEELSLARHAPLELPRFIDPSLAASFHGDLSLKQSRQQVASEGGKVLIAESGVEKFHLAMMLRKFLHLLAMLAHGRPMSGALVQPVKQWLQVVAPTTHVRDLAPGLDVPLNALS